MGDALGDWGGVNLQFSSNGPASLQVADKKEFKVALQVSPSRLGLWDFFYWSCRPASLSLSLQSLAPRIRCVITGKSKGSWLFMCMMISSFLLVWFRDGSEYRSEWEKGAYCKVEHSNLIHIALYSPFVHILLLYNRHMRIYIYAIVQSGDLSIARIVLAHRSFINICKVCGMYIHTER